MKKTLFVLLAICALLSGCGTNPIFTMIPDYGAGALNSVTIAMSAATGSDPVPLTSLAVLPAKNPVIAWTDSTGLAAAKLRVTVTLVASGVSTVYWQVYCPLAALTQVTYGTTPAGGTVVTAKKVLGTGCYKIKLETAPDFTVSSPAVATCGTATLVVQ